MEKNLKQLLGYIKANPNLGIMAINARDSWEELKLVAYCDASFAAPKSTTGWMLYLLGPNGSSYLLEWSSKRQAVASTSSAEAEILALAAASKAALRVGGMIDLTRKKPVDIVVRIDNEAARLAAARGNSQALGHLAKHAGLSLAFLSQTGIDFQRVPTAKNVADLLTKPLASAQLSALMDRTQQPPFASETDQ